MDIILQTFGTLISRDGEGFVVSNKNGTQRIPAQDVSSLQVSRGVQITSDAIMLAISHEVEVLFINKSGDPLGRVWSSRYGSVSTIRKGQLLFCASKQAMEWVKSTLSKKVLNQQAMLLSLSQTNSHIRQDADRAISRMEECRLKIQGIQGNSIRDVEHSLRGWEGQASKIYFETCDLTLPQQFRFGGRSQHPAMNVANALLNYAYGMLYGKIEGSLIRAGIDPYLGVMHRDQYNRPVLVYDVIEEYRIWADYVAMHILSQCILTHEYFSVRDDGSYWLEPLGRRVLIQSLNDYLDEIINMDGLSRTRSTHLDLAMQRLAQLFKGQEDANRKKV